MCLKLIVPALLSLASLAMPAFADQYQLTLDACGRRGCGTAPFGTIDVTQKGLNTVNIAVSLNPGNKFIGTGFQQNFGFDIIGNPTITLSNLPGGWSLVSHAAGSLNFGAFGSLDYALTCNNQTCGHGNPHQFSGPLSFDVTATGLTPGSFKELSRPGSEAAYFAADIWGSTGRTGPVGATFVETQAASATPEPSSLLLLGTGVGLLGFSWFRRRRKA
jgi:hypothetical protein